MSAAAIQALVDLRSLQQDGYAGRGVGYHSASLLRYAHEHLQGTVRLVALLDDRLGTLPAEFLGLVDAVRYRFIGSDGSNPSVYINPSPMTQDPLLGSPYLGRSNILSAAVVYDFIPLDYLTYLGAWQARAGYAGCLQMLRLYDLYFPISRYSARRLMEVCEVDAQRVHVTGAAVRETVGMHATRSAPGATGQLTSSEPAALPYFLTVGGDDIRKNSEVAVEAIAVLNAACGPCRLKVLGVHTELYRNRLCRTAAKFGLSPARLEFLEKVGDEALADLYRNAVAAIAPSLAEGFSLPVAEAGSCGTPVIASDCDAHLELVHQAQALFPAHDAGALADRMRALFADPGARQELAARQSLHWRQHKAPYVAQRFWERLLEESRRRFGQPHGPAAVGRRKRRLAFVTPYPPDKSGVAVYSQRTLHAVASRFDVELYTNAPVSPAERRRFARVGGISDWPYVRSSADTIVSVVGNSVPFHADIIERVEYFGGPCILHDSRLSEYYQRRLGDKKFRKWAEEITGKPVTRQDVRGWLAQEDSCPSLFLDRIIRKAQPLIVHSKRIQTRLERDYGVRATALPFALMREFRDEELAEPARLEAKSRLGLLPDTLVIASFGFVSANKGAAACVQALRQLRDWGIPAELHFVGSDDYADPSLMAAVSELGLKSHVHMRADFLPEPVYRDYLLAADAGIQLRSYDLGQVSAALSDCIGAGVPTVASAGIAASCDATSYVAPVSNPASAAAIAEAARTLIEGGLHRRRISAERNQYVAEHSFVRYAQQLAETLG